MSSTNRDRPPAVGELVPMKFSASPAAVSSSACSLTQLITSAIGEPLISALYSRRRDAARPHRAHLRTHRRADLDTIAGRPIVDGCPSPRWWLWRATGGQLLYRRRIVVPAPSAPSSLPGDMA